MPTYGYEMYKQYARGDTRPSSARQAKAAAENLPPPAPHRPAPAPLPPAAAAPAEHRMAPKPPPGSRRTASGRSPRIPTAWDDEETGYGAGPREQQTVNRFLPQRTVKLPSYGDRMRLQYGPEGPNGRGERTAAEQLQREFGLTAQLLKTAHEQIAHEQEQVAGLRMAESRAASAAEQAKAQMQAMAEEQERAQAALIAEMAEQRSTLEVELEQTRGERRAQLELARMAEDSIRELRQDIKEQEERIAKMQARAHLGTLGREDGWRHARPPADPLTCAPTHPCYLRARTRVTVPCRAELFAELFVALYSTGSARARLGDGATDGRGADAAAGCA